MRPRGAGSHTVRISPILILIFFCQRSVERGEAPTPEREGNKGGGGRERGEERERGEAAEPRVQQNREGQARPRNPQHAHAPQRGEREGKEREGKEREGKETQPAEPPKRNKPPTRK